VTATELAATESILPGISVPSRVLMLTRVTLERGVLAGDVGEAGRGFVRLEAV
jgi:hypothetical protein